MKIVEVDVIRTAGEDGRYLPGAVSRCGRYYYNFLNGRWFEHDWGENAMHLLSNDFGGKLIHGKFKIKVTEE